MASDQKNQTPSPPRFPSSRSSIVSLPSLGPSLSESLASSITSWSEAPTPPDEIPPSGHPCPPLVPLGLILHNPWERLYNSVQPQLFNILARAIGDSAFKYGFYQLRRDAQTPRAKAVLVVMVLNRHLKGYEPLEAQVRRHCSQYWTFRLPPIRFWGVENFSAPLRKDAPDFQPIPEVEKLARVEDGPDPADKPESALRQSFPTWSELSASDSVKEQLNAPTIKSSMRRESKAPDDEQKRVRIIEPKEEEKEETRNDEGHKEETYGKEGNPTGTWKNKTQLHSHHRR